MILSSGLQLSGVGVGSHNCCWILSGVCGWWVCYQGLGQMCILSGPWVDGTTSETLVNRASAVKGSILGSADSGPLSRCMDWYGSHWIPGEGSCPFTGHSWVGRTGPRMQLSRAGTKS